MTKFSAFPWLVTGFTLGVVTGLLMAPRSGSETRQLVLKKGLDKAEDIIGEDRVEKGRRIYERGREIQELAKDTVDVARRARRVRRPLETEE